MKVVYLVHQKVLILVVHVKRIIIYVIIYVVVTQILYYLMDNVEKNVKVVLQIIQMEYVLIVLKDVVYAKINKITLVHNVHLVIF
jgi:hypothetical protein